MTHDQLKALIRAGYRTASEAAQWLRAHRIICGGVR